MEFAPEQPAVSARPLNLSAQDPPMRTKVENDLRNLMFGSIAGMTGKLVEYPFDTVKVRLQAQPSGRRLFAGPLDCFRITIRHEGFRGLYRGLSSPMIGAMLETAMLFVTYHHVQMMIREYVTPPHNQHLYTKEPHQAPPLGMSQLCLAGAVSGALASFVLTPVELIKCKLQVQETFSYNGTSAPKTATASTATATHPHYKGPLSIIARTIREHGVTGFYRGHSGTLVRETGGGAVWFGVYEYVASAFVEYKRRSGGSKVASTKSDLNTAQLMTAGAMAGMFYNFLVFPADSVKSLMQTDEEIMASLGKKFERRGFFQVARELYRSDGIRGFYRGCGMTVARSAPSSAIIFATYELLARYF